MKAMLEPRIVAARTHRAVARVHGDGSVARRIASSQGPRAATFIAECRSTGYAERSLAGRGCHQRSKNRSNSGRLRDSGPEAIYFSRIASTSTVM
jgi:hypothetical protein